MKRICVVMLCFFVSRAFAQVDTVKPRELLVSYHATTNLIFPYAIKSVDRGSAAVLVQKAKGVENILQVKAGKKGFAPTNLSVVTSDGKFYSFVVKYGVDSVMTAIRLGDAVSAQFEKGVPNAASLQQLAYAVKVQPAQRLKRVFRNDIALRLSGLFFTGDNVWLKLNVRNGSPLDFRPERVRFFLRDRAQPLRTAIQEKEIEPLFSDITSNVPYYSCGQLIVGLPAFIIPEGKKLVIQIAEDENGRMMEMTLKPRMWRRGIRL